MPHPRLGSNPGIALLLHHCAISFSLFSPARSPLFTAPAHHAVASETVLLGSMALWRTPAYNHDTGRTPPQYTTTRKV